MIVYESTKDIFLDAVLKDSIVDKIYENYRKIFRKNTSESEIKSWKNSMQYMYKILIDENIPNNCGIAIEFNIPSTSKRIDFLISGIDNNKNDNVIIIELKQWDNVEKVEGKEDIVKTYIGGSMREVTHPSYQVWSYATLIEDFNETVQNDKIKIYPCVYMHNYKIDKNDPIIDYTYEKYLKLAPLYGNGDAMKLRQFITKYIKYGDNKEIIYKIENGKIRPSKRLQDALSSMLKGNKEFIMIDDQKILYETAINMATKSYQDGTKRILIVEGGPGTGKSVIAINLLVELTKRHMVTNYVTKNSAPRNVFYKMLKGKFKESFIKNLFKGSGIFTDIETNLFDALIVDEAHRLNEKSGMFKNYGENQIKEIINAAKFSVFFIDENQKVTINDIGDIEIIKKYAKECNAEFKILELESQFRCNGSDGYLAWLDYVLQIRKTANFDGFEYDYDFRVIDDPNELKRLIVEKNKINNKSRLLAGYCWDWISTGKNDSNVHDIIIPEYNFSMSWNLYNTNTWAIDPTSINEIGCIHTSQGLEFDYVGVIIGDDMKYKDGKIITNFNNRAKTDKSLHGIKKIYKENPEKALQIADNIIKNTYRTLMTRGMKGCYIYCTDKELQQYFKNKIQNKYFK